MNFFQICSQHEQEGISVPIQPVPTSEDVEQYTEEINYNSLGRREAYLMKRVQPELSDPSKIVTKLALWFPCWNKCGKSVRDFAGTFQQFHCRDFHLPRGLDIVNEVHQRSRERHIPLS